MANPFCDGLQNTNPMTDLNMTDLKSTHLTLLADATFLYVQDRT
jgi:hypothetical protein